MTRIPHQLFSSEFLPHGTCYLWNPKIVWLHVIADGVITLSYYCIPFALVYLVRRRRDLPFNWIFWMFGLFILGCGTTHLMEIWTIWHPTYFLSGVIKAVTAAISVATALALVRLIPKAVALPSPDALRAINAELEEQIAIRKQRELELCRATEQLEQRVDERTREIESTNESLENEIAAGLRTQAALKGSEEEIRTLNQELEHRVHDRTRKLEAANRELEAFTYSVSHDLRSPLRHIAGFSKMLEEESGNSLNPEAQHYLRRIQDGTHRMAMLVDDLLGLARIGRHELRLEGTGIESIVKEVIADLAPDTEGRAVEWKVGGLPFVEGDPALLKVVLHNLLSNALKYSRPREQAVIEIGRQDVDGQPVIFVRDNGVGFNMKYADKLFGVFQRLHRVEDFEGTGVGLATVQRIVQKHGGRIWAQAELDKGATFYFSLRGATENNQERTAAGGAS